MKFIEVDVKTEIIVHGYDDENREIIEDVHDQSFMTKLVAIDRIQSISDQFLLVSSSHGRVMYWEYKGMMSDLKRKLADAGLMV